MAGPRVLYACAGGTIVLPAVGAALADRSDGGNLVVNPPRDAWERSALTVPELTAWAHLVAAAGEAMLELPQLKDGCINYWEAGNWALNEAAPPVGPKFAPQHRSVHMHLIGRSRTAASPDHVWGEAPRFPSYADRLDWAAGHDLFTPQECAAIVTRANALLAEKYAMTDREDCQICEHCAYPRPSRGHQCS